MVIAARGTGNDGGQIVNVHWFCNVSLKARQYRLSCAVPVSEAGYRDGGRSRA